MEQTTQKTSPKDFFLHLLSIVALYASAVSFSTLIFQCINYWFPDVLGGGYYSQSSMSFEPMRWAIAMLIVFFPTYVVTGIFLNKEYKINIEKKELRIRKWLLYFTLFVAALIILGDIVTLLLNFMRGELTARFVFKVITIFFVSGSIFGYYLWELKNKEFTKRVKVFIYSISAIMGIAVVVGLFIAGSPGAERARRFDEQRVFDLQILQSEIVNYWQRKKILPENLDVLNDGIKGFVVPKDPRTGDVYVYKISEKPETFILCATFETDSYEGIQTLVAIPWGHSIGETCFQRTIDKDLYPPMDNNSRSPIIPIRSK
jgi:hypothetical protein